MSTFVAGPEICCLLKEDYYIEKVLEKLVDDGMHICRRVCRRWRDVCDKLPLKIKPISMEKLSQLPQRFQRITSVTLSTSNSPSNAFSLRQLSHLRHLQLHFSPDKLLPEMMSRIPYSMTHLHALTLRIGSCDILHSFIPVLRQLTQLTSLDIKFDKAAGLMRIEPISELRRMKELKLSASLLVNDVGELLFPKVMHLTELAVYTHTCSSEGMKIPVVEVIHTCVWNLRTLHLGYSNILTFTDATSLARFSRLESLRLDDIHCKDGGLATGLRRMNALTALDIRNARGDVELLLSTMFRMTSLTSLRFISFQSPAPKVELPSSFAERTQLRRLHLSGIQLQSMISCAAGLTDLKIETARDLPPNLAECLVPMTGLVTLALVNGGRRFSLASRALSQMKQLQALALEQVEVDRHFFTTLANLSGLTELRMVHYGHELNRPDFRTQINLLSGLRVLDFQCGMSGVSPLEYLIEGKLERLKDLTCSCSERNAVDVRELYRKFPSLHKHHLKFNLDGFEEL